jgi:hypothetical protein
MLKGFFTPGEDEKFSFDDLDRRKRLAEALMQQGSDYSPVQSWTQGAARLAQAISGSLHRDYASKLGQQGQKAFDQKHEKMIQAMFGGGPPAMGGASPPAPSMAPAPMGGAPAMASSGGASMPGDMAKFAEAIKKKESAGSGGYAAVGPTHPKLGRALGAYQVMEANIGPWSKEALGREVTPDEFMRNPQIQDQIFQHKFGQYLQKFGNPQDAASAWFTGQPLSVGANRRDVLGTTGSRYVQDFNRNIGQPSPGQQPQQPVQVASAGGMTPDGMPMGPVPSNAPPMSFAAGQQPAPPSPFGTLDASRAAMSPQGSMPAPNAAQAGPAPMPQQQQPQPGAALVGALGGQQPQQPQTSPPIPQPQPTGNVQAAMMQILSDPRFSPQQKQQAMQMFQMYQAQNNKNPMVIPEGGTLYDPRTGRIIQPGGGKQTDAIRNYQYYVQQERAAGREPKNMDQWQIDQRRAGATNLNVDTKGQQGMLQKGIEAFDNAITAERDASRRIASYGQLAQAMQGFTPGATAEMRVAAQSVLRDLGLIKGNEVPNAQTFKSIQRRLELAAVPKGQGTITENERVLIRETIPAIGNDPQAIARIVQNLERLDRFDIAVAKIYRDNARKNGGVPNYLEVSEQISALGPPITDDELIALQDLKSSIRQPAGPAKNDSPSGPRKTVGGKTYEMRGKDWFEVQ